MRRMLGQLIRLAKGILASSRTPSLDRLRVTFGFFLNISDAVCERKTMQ